MLCYLLPGLLLNIWGCESTKPVVYQALTEYVVEGRHPLSVAVLPFENHSGTEGLDELLRISIFSHLCARSYKDIELHEVDRRLLEIGLPHGADLTAEPVNRLGRLLQCDALIFGEVTSFERLFFGIYSRLSVKGAITMVDTRNGQQIWVDQLTADFHEGGIPLHLLDIPLISFRAGFNLRDTVKIRAVDELARRIVARIPAPTPRVDVTSGAPLYAYELQVGAFLDKEYAIRLLENMRRKGYPAFLRSNRRGSDLWYRVLLGPYEDWDEAVGRRQRVRREVNADAYISRVRVTQGSSPDETE